MRQSLLVFILMLSTSVFSMAQNCGLEADKRMKTVNEAMVDAKNKNDRAYDSLRAEVYSIFKLLESCVARNPSYEAKSKVNKVSLYHMLTDYSGNLKKFKDMLDYIEALERLLPTPNAISASAASSFTLEGKNYTAKISYQDIERYYYEIKEQRTNYAYFAEKNNSKVIENYKPVLSAPLSFKPDALEALLYADAMYKSGKGKAEYFPAMVRAVELFGTKWASKEEHDSAEINNHSLMIRWFEREMNSYNKADLNTADPGGNQRLKAARGLVLAERKDLAKNYAQSGAQNGANKKEDGFWYLDFLAENETEHVKAALKILERNSSFLSEQEMNRLLPLATQNGLTDFAENMRQRLRKIAALRKRTTISLVPAVELIGLPFGHVPVSLNLRTGRIWQEFRFDYVWGAKTRYRFGMFRTKGSEKGERYEFTGWDAGYAFTYLLKNGFRQGNKKGGRSAFYCAGFGFDLRYANWNFAPIISNVYNDDNQLTESNVLINAKTNRFELCYRTSLVAMTRFVTFEYYLGLGLGYRRLSTAQGRDVEKENFEDPRLNAERWNKFYMPLRLGLKLGLNIL